MVMNIARHPEKKRRKFISASSQHQTNIGGQLKPLNNSPGSYSYVTFSDNGYSFEESCLLVVKIQNGKDGCFHSLFTTGSFRRPNFTLQIGFMRLPKIYLTIKNEKIHLTKQTWLFDKNKQKKKQLLTLVRD